MSDQRHEDVVRESFKHQVTDFSGSDSVYVRREGPLSWIEPLDPSMVALEVACGAAHAAESVALHLRQIIGLDLTPELLEVGKSRLDENGVDNVLLQEGNAEALPFLDASFDVVFCRSSLHHFADPARAIAEMKRVTKPGGRVALVDLVVPSDVDRELFDTLHRHLDPSHVRAYTENELLAEARSEMTLAYAESSKHRFPIDVAITDVSDPVPVLEALRGEVQGGERTGFEPEADSDSFVVSFAICVVQAQKSP